MRVEAAESVERRPISEAPWSVKAYVALQVLSLALWTVLDGDLWRAVGGLVISGVFTFGILFGYRAAWAVSVIFSALGIFGTIGFVISVVEGNELSPDQWSSFGFYLASTVMLLHPLTRAWANR